jgi:hypothetical protein
MPEATEIDLPPERTPLVCVSHAGLMTNRVPISAARNDISDIPVTATWKGESAQRMA